MIGCGFKMGKEKEEELNPSKRIQDEEDSEKEEIKRLYESLASKRRVADAWKSRAIKMEKQRNEWRLICSFMLIILVIICVFKIIKIF